jgi:hypothetical protein
MGPFSAGTSKKMGIKVDMALHKFTPLAGIHIFVESEAPKPARFTGQPFGRYKKSFNGRCV